MEFLFLNFFNWFRSPIFEHQQTWGGLRGEVALNADSRFLCETPDVCRLVLKDHIRGQKLSHLNLNRILLSLLHESRRVIYHSHSFVVFMGSWEARDYFEISFEYVGSVPASRVAIVYQKLDHYFFRSFPKYWYILAVTANDPAEQFQSFFGS